jgi:hypothetical protein
VKALLVRLFHVAAAHSTGCEIGWRR